ncbi:MAG: outer membrane lipoprotein LolB [Betaproteobacteria bacterium]|nr:outer membrane lipoprotein LolB [Betaproteobacteria bacterium]
MSQEQELVAYMRRLEFLRRRFCVGMLPAIIVASLLPGCAAIDPMPATSAAPALATGLLPAKYFTLRGRISVRVGDKIESAQIRWTKTPDEERLEVFTPFGSQVAELVRSDGGGVTLRREHEITTAESIAELTSSLLGVALDMDAIAIWTQGIGLKENESIERRFGNGAAWQVTVERLQNRGIHRYASRLSAISGDTVVRLVIDEWRSE